MIHFLHITSVQLLKIVKNDTNLINYVKNTTENKSTSPIVGHQLCLIERFIFSAITILSAYLKIHNKSCNGGQNNINLLSASQMMTHSNSGLDPEILILFNQILLALLELTSIFGAITF